MKNYILIALCFCSIAVNAQVKQLDKLEVLYTQGHYGMVYRKSNRLLQKPDFDYSYQPEFYKAMSIFRLSEKRTWRTFHHGKLQEARKLFLEVKNSPEGVKVFNAHLDQVLELRKVLAERVEKLKKDAFKKDEYDELQQILFGLFDNIPDLENPTGVKPETSPDVEAIAETNIMTKSRDLMFANAKEHLGTPYLWAGDTPKGFDCSGFTSYMHSKMGVDIPRRAEDQYKSSTKLKQRNVQKGDLVFFNNGSGVSHVGIIVSEKGAPLTMIHSSSSQGIVITNIEDSDYWTKRLHGFGTYINKVSESKK